MDRGRYLMLALAITGPTASGKTALSLALADAIGAEIISCDSMQIYKYMDIGTAKATVEERERAPHHMIDFLSPTESYSAERYRADALKCAEDITARGKIPLFVGGTGLYIDTVMRGASADAPESSLEYREAMLKIAERDGGAHELWMRLCEVDPESAEKIHENNVKRVIRALEIFDTTGVPKSVLDRESREDASDVRVGMITLDFHNRDNLYERANARVDAMIAEGLIDEVTRMDEMGFLDGTTTASQAIGYKELLPYVKGECTLDDATEKLKLSTRRYAKRQLTWFRHETDAVRIYVDREDGQMKNFDEIRREIISAAGEIINNHKCEGKA